MSIRLSPLVKQAFGGIVGMLLAVGLYYAVQSVGIQGLGAMVVGPHSIFSAKSGQVVVNDKTVDAQTIARLAARAKQVGEQLASAAPATVDTTAVAATTDRRTVQLQAFRQVTRSATDLSSIDQRVYARRQDRLAQAPTDATHAAAGAPAMHAGADLSSGRLNQSGPLTDSLLIASVVLAALVSGAMRIRRRVFAFGKA